MKAQQQLVEILTALGMERRAAEERAHSFVNALMNEAMQHVERQATERANWQRALAERQALHG